jgi:hypothetical protein
LKASVVKILAIANIGLSLLDEFCCSYVSLSLQKAHVGMQRITLFDDTKVDWLFFGAADCAENGNKQMNAMTRRQ